ncbi:MAG: hypothetical protein ACI4IJ_11400 [Acutalibacteraceae bacterium]
MKWRKYFIQAAGIFCALNCGLMKYTYKEKSNSGKISNSNFPHHKQPKANNLEKQNKLNITQPERYVKNRGKRKIKRRTEMAK